MTQLYKHLLVVVLFLFSGVYTFAQTTVSFTPSKDNTIYSDLTSNSNGLGVNFTAGKTSGGGIRRALLAFDLSSIPTGATVTAVTLTLHMNKTKPGADNVAVHKLLSDWGEGTSDPGTPNDGQGAAATIGDATWTQNFFGSTLWGTAGGSYTSTPSAVTSVAATVGNYNWSSATLISDVQTWVNASATNFGWIIRSNETTNSTANRFDSRQSTTASFRPKLTVIYTVAAPVTLTSFRASQKPAGVLLSWETTSEINNASFQLEHSTDGVNFKAINSQAGAGTSSLRHAYQFLHRESKIGKNFYRIAQVDYSNTVNYSNTISVAVSSPTRSVILSPNPAINTISVVGTAATAGVKYTIVNSLGALVKLGTLTSTDIQISNLTAGNYYLKVIDVDGVETTTAFIKH
jgi:hypothetical protein